MGDAGVSSISSADALSGAKVHVRLGRSDLEALLRGQRVEIERDEQGLWAEEPVAKVTIAAI